MEHSAVLRLSTQGSLLEMLKGRNVVLGKELNLLQTKQIPYLLYLLSPGFQTSLHNYYEYIGTRMIINILNVLLSVSLSLQILCKIYYLEIFLNKLDGTEELGVVTQKQQVI